MEYAQHVFALIRARRAGQDSRLPEGGINVPNMKWLRLLLNGTKTWDLHSDTVRPHRWGKEYALINGSWAYGKATLVSSHKVSHTEFHQRSEFHCIASGTPEHCAFNNMIPKGLHAWVFDKPVWFAEPYPVRRQQGPVNWIKVQKHEGTPGDDPKPRTEDSDETQLSRRLSKEALVAIQGRKHDEKTEMTNAMVLACLERTEPEPAKQGNPKRPNPQSIQDHNKKPCKRPSITLAAKLFIVDELKRLQKEKVDKPERALLRKFGEGTTGIPPSGRFLRQGQAGKWEKTALEQHWRALGQKTLDESKELPKHAREQLRKKPKGPAPFSGLPESCLGMIDEVLATKCSAAGPSHSEESGELGRETLRQTFGGVHAKINEAIKDHNKSSIEHNQELARKLRSGEITYQEAAQDKKQLKIQVPEKVSLKTMRRFTEKYGWEKYHVQKPSKFLPYEHESMKTIRDYVREVVEEHKVHPRLVLNIDQIWTMRWTPEKTKLHKPGAAAGPFLIK